MPPKGMTISVSDEKFCLGEQKIQSQLIRNFASGSKKVFPATNLYPEPDESCLLSHPTSLRSILTLSFHLCLGLDVVSFP
jgi:hypothetical protein